MLVPRVNTDSNNPIEIKAKQFNGATDDEKKDEFNYNHDYEDQAQKPRSVSDGTPIDWILNNPNENLGNLLKQIRDNKLPQYLIEMVEKIEGKQGDGDCVKLLLCKSAPFIWGMQKAIIERIDGVLADDADNEVILKKKDRMSQMFKHIPELDEFKIHGDACELRYSKCIIFD